MVPPKCVLVLHVSWPCVLTLAVSWQGDMLLKVPWLGVLHGVTAVSPGSGGAMVVCLSPQGALAACHCPEAVMIPCPYLNGSVAPCHPEGAVAECPDLWGSRCYVLFMRLSCHGVMLPKLSWPLILLPSVPWQRAEGAISVLVPMVPVVPPGLEGAIAACPVCVMFLCPGSGGVTPSCPGADSAVASCPAHEDVTAACCGSKGAVRVIVLRARQCVLGLQVSWCCAMVLRVTLRHGLALWVPPPCVLVLSVS